MGYELHPLALAIPPMQEEAYQKLKEDIAQNGIRLTILLYEGKILDGRYRYQAAIELGFEPQFEPYEGDDPLGYLFSVNFYRRNLTHTQRCVVALQALAYQAEQGKERQREAGKRTAQMKKEGITPSLESEKPQPKKRAPQSRDIVGKTVGVSGTEISITKKILEESPELLDKMKNGALELSDAKILNVFKTEHPTLYPDVLQRMEQFPELKAQAVVNAVRNEKITASNDGLTFTSQQRFKVIYSDPPWSYGTPPPGVAGIENHYPTMTIPELCAMGEHVKVVSDDDCVLFMWTTSPHLELSFQVVRAWGFEYKTTFVWHKIKHNMGFYNSVRHELLLVCTKGKGTPERLMFEMQEGVLGYKRFKPEPSVFPSVHLDSSQFKMTPEAYEQEMEYVEEPLDSVYEEKRTVHSKKPMYYYHLINRLYPNAPKLEMFCRSPQAGWTAWGNQSDGEDLAKKMKKEK
ncbi:MAG: MT-A70 family methyltransferase [Gallionella sp.]